MKKQSKLGENERLSKVHSASFKSWIKVSNNKQKQVSQVGTWKDPAIVGENRLDFCDYLSHNKLIYSNL